MRTHLCSNVKSTLSTLGLEIMIALPWGVGRCFFASEATSTDLESQQTSKELQSEASSYIFQPSGDDLNPAKMP